MKEDFMGLIIFLGIVAVIVIWLVSAQQRLVRADEMCKNAMSQIGVQQNSRWDALTQIAGLAKKYSEFEYQALKEIIAQRRPITGGSSTDEAQAQENKITEALTHIMAVAEQYPALKSSELYQQTMKDVNRYEDNVRKARMVFNDTVTKLNRLVRQFPDSLAASIFGFKEREYLQTPSEKTEMPNLV